MDTLFGIPLLAVPLYAIVGAAVSIYVPYGLVAYGRLKTGYDAYAPRTTFDRLPDYAKRAQWAHQNSFEVFMPFAAAALMVFVTAPHPATIFGLGSDQVAAVAAVGFVLSRLTYAAAYIGNQPIFRSLSWLVSVATTALLMWIALSAVTTTI